MNVVTIQEGTRDKCRRDGRWLKLSATLKEAVADAEAEIRKKKSPKRVLALPDLEHAKTAVLNSLTSASGQRTYDHAIREFVAWYCSEPRLAFNRTVVLRYRIHLEQRGYAPATVNLRLAAVRRIAYETADAGLLSPELAAGIRRVKGVRRIGVRLENWLTPEQGRRLLEATTPGSPREVRDQAMVAMLIGCGLRRGELLALRLESIQQREEHWVIADLVGKAGHVRTVPIPTWVKHAVDAWTAAAHITDGRIFRAINKAGRVWETACRRRCSGTWSARRRLAPASTSWRRTICDEPVPVSAIWPAVNSTRSSSCSATSPSRRRSATSDANRNSGLR
jgi:integrase